MDARDEPAARGRAGISRRDVLKRSAIVGGTLVWAAPAVQTIGGRAFAAPVGSQPPTGPGFDISFVALLLNCGGHLYRVKFGTGSVTAPECGSTFSVGNCGNQLSQNAVHISSGCPSGVSATQASDTSITVNLGSCTVQDFVVKSGECCAGPGQAGEPAAGSGGSITFPRPTSNGVECS